MEGTNLNVPIENILLERINKDQLISRLQTHGEDFKECVRIASSTKQPQAWRGAWILNHCIQDNDIRVRDFIPAFLEVINYTIDGHQREILKILLRMDLDEDQEGLLFDACLHIWEAVGKSSSVRITAFKVLSGITRKYPDLLNELEFAVQEQYLEPLSPAIKTSAIKIWSEIDPKRLIKRKIENKF